MCGAAWDWSGWWHAPPLGGGACQGAASLVADTHVGTGFDVRSADCDIAGMQPQVRASLSWWKKAMRATWDVSLQVDGKMLCGERKWCVGLTGFWWGSGPLLPTLPASCPRVWLPQWQAMVGCSWIFDQAFGCISQSIPTSKYPSISASFPTDKAFCFQG